MCAAIQWLAHNGYITSSCMLSVGLLVVSHAVAATVINRETLLWILKQIMAMYTSKIWSLCEGQCEVLLS